MLEINEQIQIPEKALEEQFILASGPGGQNVNKVATAVQLRLHLEFAELPEEVLARFRHLERNHISDAGDWVIVARRFRSQEKNRHDARERLKTRILKALEKPKPRKATKPSRAAKEKRLENKRRQSERKKDRKKDWT